MNTQADWWRGFFSGVFVECWLKAVGPEQTRKEADFVQEALGVQPPARLLDVPCGGGRHSLALAERGFEMTGIDLSPEFLAAARAQCQAMNLTGKITWNEREMRDLGDEAQYDGVCCLGNSFGYLDDEGNAAFLQAVARVLRPGARFVLETGYVAECLLPVLQERSWYQMGDILMLAQRRYDTVASRLHVEYTMIRDGVMDKRPTSSRIHSHREVISLFHQAGFNDLQSFGSLSRDPFKLGSPNLLIVATKPTT
jgi:SAM-dependent methyltransferase